VNLLLVKFILYSYILSTTAPRRKLCAEDIESKVICDTDSGKYVEDTESERMKMITVMNNRHHQSNNNF
jgi:hypothetical protein